MRNIHAMIHRALVDAVAWNYIPYNPASNIKPPKRPRRRRTVWNPGQIQTFLMSVQRDRFAALFLLELTTGIRRGHICDPKWSGVDLDTGEITVHDNRVVVGGHARDKAGGKLATPTKRYRLTGPPLPRCVDDASGKAANGNCSVPPITQATTCSPSRTAARRCTTSAGSVDNGAADSSIIPLRCSNFRNPARPATRGHRRSLAHAGCTVAAAAGSWISGCRSRA